MRVVLALASTGCLIADVPPDGEWRSLSGQCMPLVGTRQTELLRGEAHLHAFLPAGETIVFDDLDGLAQLDLRTGERRMIARTNSDEPTTEFQALGDDLVYYARAPNFEERELIVDRGVDDQPRWSVVGTFRKDDFTRVLANPAGVYLRTDSDKRWRRWSLASQTIVSTPLPDNADVTSDGTQLFYADSMFQQERGLFTLPVEGGEPTFVARIDQFTELVGVWNGRLFVWHQDPPNSLDEVTPQGPRAITELPVLGVPARRTFGGGYFYWAPKVEFQTDSIHRVSLDGGPQERVATVGGDIGTLHADDCNVYWQVVGDDGTVDLYGMRH